MTTTLSISQLITDAIASLPEKVRYKCDRAKIDKWLERYGCTCDAELLLAALNREDSRAALKMHAPPILMAKLLVWLSPKVVGGDGNELPPGFELLLHEPLPEDTLAHAGMRQSTRVVTFPFATPSQGQRRLRPPKLIRGAPPARADLDLMCPLYSCERALYPAAFLDKIGLCTVFFCEQLSYDGQRRRDVPDLDGGTLFIDVSDRAVRRSRHAWHHELWHMADFQLRGPAFEQPDAEWEAHNPDSFTYGFGGQFMRTPGTADPPSAPSEHFINAYATSSIAEDKAEVWAALLCYEHVLRTRSLRAKANLLKQRAAALCPEIGASFWEIVRWHQRALGKEWEPCWYELEEATFSAGDPRFMQKSFDELKYLGVRRSEVGMLGDVPAIRVSFDSRKVTYQRVLGNFWRSCDPTKEEQFGQPGPTIVWVASEPQRKLAEESRRRLQLSTEYRSPTFGPMFKGRPVLTEIRALTGEWMASAEQQDFYLRDAKAYEAACKKTGRTKWFVEEFQPVTVTACQKEKQGSGGEGIVCGFVYFPCNEENGCSAVTKGEF